MPPDEEGVGTPPEWLRHAISNLEIAKEPRPRVLLEHLCFEAQQAAEKALKAVLVFRGIEFPKTHDLRVLLTILDPTGRELPQQIWQAVDLTDFAVEPRYPGMGEPVSEEEYRKAVVIAEEIVRWAEGIVHGR